MDGKWKIFLIFILAGFKGYSQYIYTYTDPCTGILQSVTITQPSGSVTLFYAGQYQTFTQTQLQAGAFELWVQSINATAPPGSNPCAGSGGTIANGSNAAIGSNTATNVSGIIGIAANIGGSISTGGTSNIGTNAGSNTSNSGSNSSSTSGSGDNSNSTGGTGSGSTGSNSGGSAGGSGGGTGDPSSGGSSTGTTGGGTSGEDPGAGQSGGEPSGGGVPDQGGSTSESGAVGGQESTTTASGGESESSGGSSSGGQRQKNRQEKIGRGSLIGAGDVVLVRNSSDIRQTGTDNFRFNTSVTHVNTKQTFIKGVNLTYTTGENVLNTTLYGSYKAKGFMGVFSNSLMTNFRTDVFNTTTALGAQKTGPLTWMAGTNFTLGSIGQSNFQNWSIVGGAFSTFKGARTFSANVMALGIYSPYIFYYEGQWYKSGLLIVPLANIDFKLTDKFKWSISFSGAYQWQADILNYQLSTGTKILL